MSGFGEHRYHGTYDDVAAELGSAARRLAAPLAVAVRQRAVKAEREAARHQAAARSAEREAARERREKARTAAMAGAGRRAAVRAAATDRATIQRDHQRWAQSKRIAPEAGRER